MDKDKVPEPAPKPDPAAPHGPPPPPRAGRLPPMAFPGPWVNLVPQQQRRLGLFICLALAIHAGICLFLIVDTSVARLRHEPHLYVSLDYPRALAVSGEAPDQFWDQLTDPRVFLQPRNTTTDLTTGLLPWMPSTAPGSDALPPAAP